MLPPRACRSSHDRGEITRTSWPSEANARHRLKQYTPRIGLSGRGKMLLKNKTRMVDRPCSAAHAIADASGLSAEARALAHSIVRDSPWPKSISGRQLKMSLLF